MSEAQGLPLATSLCAALALAGALGLAAWGLIQAHCWRRLSAELGDISVALEQSHASQQHRQLYRSFDNVREELWALSADRRQARAAFERLLPAVAQFHSRGMAGGAEEWAETRDGLLEQLGRPLRLVRVAAGWVVLLGLAGTVLGFSQAIPALHEVLTQPAPADRAANSEDSAGNQEAAAVPRVQLVLSRLKGVFLATFSGAVGALLLSGVAALRLEPALGRAAQEVDRFGSRWLVPLIVAPDTLLDDTLRHELRGYFDEVARRVELALSPVVQRLVVELGKMEGLSSGFALNLESGQRTIATFHSAVGQLGSAAAGAVGELVRIVDSSRSFIRELTELQTQGREQLTAAARTLADPVEAMAGSAAAMEQRLEALDRRLEGLGTSTTGIAAAVAELSAGGQSLSKEVGVRSSALSEGLAQAQAALDRLPALAPILASNLSESLHRESFALRGQFQEREQQLVTMQLEATGQVATGLESLATNLGRLERQMAPLPGLVEQLLVVQQALSQELRSMAQAEPSATLSASSLQEAVPKVEAEAQSLTAALQPALSDLRWSIDALRAELAAARKAPAAKVGKKGAKTAVMSPAEAQSVPPAELVVDPNRLLEEIRQSLSGVREAMEKLNEASDLQREGVNALRKEALSRVVPPATATASRPSLVRRLLGLAREST